METKRPDWALPISADRGITDREGILDAPIPVPAEDPHYRPSRPLLDTIIQRIQNKRDRQRPLDFLWAIFDDESVADFDRETALSVVAYAFKRRFQAERPDTELLLDYISFNTGQQIYRQNEVLIPFLMSGRIFDSDLDRLKESLKTGNDTLEKFKSDLELNYLSGHDESHSSKRKTRIYIRKWNDELDFTDYLLGRLTEDNRSLPDLTTVQRLERLLRYAERHGDVGLAKLAQTLFPEWASEADKETISPRADGMPLPTTAPEIYSGLRGPESPPQFVMRVYQPWLGHGLDRAHIRQLDPKLYTAINNWLSRPSNVWPEDVELPTREEQNRRMIDQLRSEAPDGQIGKVLGDFTSREAMRIRSVMQRQNK